MTTDCGWDNENGPLTVAVGGWLEEKLVIGKL